VYQESTLKRYLDLENKTRKNMFNRKISHGKMLLKFEDYFLTLFYHFAFAEQVSLVERFLRKGIMYI